MGATVYLNANGMRQRQDVMSGGSYVSTNDPRPHFGLGDATDAGTAEIHWPSGAKETVKLPSVDRIYTITEGHGITSAMCAGQACPVCGRRSGFKATPEQAVMEAFCVELRSLPCLRCLRPACSASELRSRRHPAAQRTSAPPWSRRASSTSPKRRACNFQHQALHTSRKYLLETMGSGVALFDCDNDGRLDLFLVNGAPYTDPTPPGFIPQKTGPQDWNRMYHQKADGTFEDITEKSGLKGVGYGMGVAVADYDNDRQRRSLRYGLWIESAVPQQRQLHFH